MIIPPSAQTPILTKDLKQTPELTSFFQAISRLPILTGSGTPEASVSAGVGRLYMDTAGTAGAILYIKRDAAVTGDPTKGWILV